MQILSKGIEFDFPLCKELKIDWKLPKNNFQFFSSSEKLKIELNIAQNQFSFFEIIANMTKPIWTFLYTDDKTVKPVVFNFQVAIENCQ